MSCKEKYTCGWVVFRIGEEMQLVGLVSHFQVTCAVVELFQVVGVIHMQPKPMTTCAWTATYGLPAPDH
jgi:hypothetical protein